MAKHFSMATNVGGDERFLVNIISFHTSRNVPDYFTSKSKEIKTGEDRIKVSLEKPK